MPSEDNIQPDDLNQLNEVLQHEESVHPEPVELRTDVANDNIS